MEYVDKEVYFNVYCPMCIDKETPETDEPCSSCLVQVSNEQSHAPTKFKPKDKDKYASFMKTLKEIQNQGGCYCDSRRCEWCEFYGGNRGGSQ